MIIESILKGIAIWLYTLFYDIVEFVGDALLDVFNMDLAYFESNVPVTNEIMSIILAAGWAILIGNLAFQSMKSMMSGIGFEGEDPKILFCRTFVFGFLLVASKQICKIGLNMTSALNVMLNTPNTIAINLPEFDVFAFPGSWLLVIIIGIVIMFQLVRFFFEIAERYVVLVILTVFAPLAFGVGGSKNTEDIFKGWARMFGAACLMMVFNTAFLKLLLSAMSNIPNGVAILPWALLVVGIARVARKIDEIVARIGLNAARTGDNLTHGGIMYPIMVARSLSGIVGKTVGGATKGATAASKTGRSGGGASKPPSPPPPPAPASSGNNPPHSPAGGSYAPSPSSASTSGAHTPDNDTNAQPTRPPVGFRGEGSNRNKSRSPEQPQGTDNSHFPKVNASGYSAIDGFDTSRGNQSQGINGRDIDSSRQDGNIGKANRSASGDKKTQAPLSVGTQTPGASMKQNSAYNNSYGRGKGGKKPNIDIYCDNDTPARSMQSRPPVSNGTKPAVSQSGSAGRQPINTPSTGAVMSGKSDLNNKQPAGSVSSQKDAQGNNGQAKTLQPQIPSAPMNAGSPRGGRISGGINEPANSHRAPSKAETSRTTGLTDSHSTTQAEATQTHRATSASSRINKSDVPSKSDRKQMGTPLPMNTGGQQNSPISPSSSAISDGQRASTPSRYRITDRSTRQQHNNTEHQHGGQPTNRSARNESGGRPAKGQDNKNNRPSPANKGEPPKRERPSGGNPPVRR